MRKRDVLQLAERYGLKISRRGCAWIFTGRGVSLLCADLRSLLPRDLEPARNRNDVQRAREQCDTMTRDFQRNHENDR
jgi:hypothetical protein